MARVQMLHHISGGRGDNTAWPEPGGFLDCGDAEAEHLVRAQIARWPEGEAAVVPADAPVPAVDAPAAASADDEPQEPENGSQDDDAADPAKPRVRDPKEAWEQHAMTVHGLDVNAARSMTKADLIATYGNP